MLSDDIVRRHIYIILYFRYMDYQIKNSDYWTLVNMLMTQITPDIRKLILDRLTEMNDQLMLPLINLNYLGGQHQQLQNSQPDLSRINNNKSKKKDMIEIPHPSLSQLNYVGQNQFSDPFIKSPLSNQSNQSNKSNQSGLNQSNLNQSNLNQSGLNPSNQFEKYNAIDEIDLDDIINDLHDEPDNLDEKLEIIKTLHNKILADKRNRRKK